MTVWLIFHAASTFGLIFLSVGDRLANVPPSQAKCADEKLATAAYGFGLKDGCVPEYGSSVRLEMEWLYAKGQFVTDYYVAGRA
jgi:hypothetical protein